MTFSIQLRTKFFPLNPFNIRMAQIRAAVAHGIKVPPEFEDNSVINPIVGTEIILFVPLAYSIFTRKKHLLTTGLQARSYILTLMS